MKATLEKLSGVEVSRLERIAKEKAAGKPLVVYNSTFIPAELIRAAGANAYLLCRGGDAGPADAALDYILESINPQARAYFGYLVKQMDALAGQADLAVIACADSHMSRVSELLAFKGSPICKVGIPADWQEELSLAYYLQSLRAMLKAVERLTGKTLDVEKAWEEFARSNRIKGCMRRLEALRKRDLVPIGIESVLRLHHICSLLTTEAEIAELEAFTKALETADPIFEQDAPRLLLIMRTAAAGDYEILRLIDESGCPVVAEVIDECACVSDAEVAPGGDPVEAFARSRYLNTLPISVFHPSWKQRFERVCGLIRENRVSGVVWYQLENDEIYDMEYSCISHWLSEMQIPSIKVETDFDYTAEKLAQKKSQILRFTAGLKSGRA